MARTRDPVCGMSVDTETARERSEFGGTTYYFCSAHCRKAFDADPQRYISAEGAAPPVPLEQHEPPHTTWRFVTSPKFGAAGSGGLEYERLPEAHGAEGK